MNESPAKRTLAFRRIAAATAAAVGAALLAAPGPAAAQTVDCASLGDNPIASTLAKALETAIACDIDVRIADHADAYTTLYATPDSQLHLVGTTEAVQEQDDQGLLDASLVEDGGTLHQASSPWAFDLSLGSGAPLVETTGASLLWDGTTPVPAYSGATAEYTGLAAGLDLAVTTDASSAELRFTVADVTAWEALATGLALTSEEGYAVADDEGFYISYGRDYQSYEWSSPFAVRDAEGVLDRAILDSDADTGAITATLPDGVLEAAAFPLTVSTSWSYHGYPVNHWGSFTSVSPDIGFHQGNAGLDEPYFAAAGETGDALAGPYCDGIEGGACTPAEAASYWTFLSPEPRWLVSYYYTYNLLFPVVEATFTVDAAEGAACVAPQLQHAEFGGWFDIGWNGLSPEEPAASGSCQGDTSVYDVTETTADEWGRNGLHSPLTFGMSDGAETARFDGGSARLDVYFDITSYKVEPRNCNTSASAPRFQTSANLAYGNFAASLWRPDLLGTDLTWTAAVEDSATGAVLVETDPAAVLNGVNATPYLTGLDDGPYQVTYRFTSADGAFDQTTNCHFVIDTAQPDVIEIAAVSGTNYIGETATIEVSVADEGFPDGVNALTVTLEPPGPGVSTQTLTEGSVATFEVDLESDSNWMIADATDKAGNHSFYERVYIDATYSRNDYNGDGHQDLFVVRKSDGHLMFYAGNGNGTFDKAVSHGAGWGGMDVVMAGDLNGDGAPDLLARDNRTGTLYNYPGDGDGGLAPRRTIGSGWNGMGSFASGGDFDGDGSLDLVGINKSNGRLYLYPGKGDGAFGSSVQVGTGWASMDAITTYGDINGDGNDDLLAHEPFWDGYDVHLGNGAGGFYDSLPMGWNLGDEDNTLRFAQVAGAGDLDGDGLADLLAVDRRTGELHLRSFDKDSPWMALDETVIGSGWGAVRLPAVATDWTYDYDGDNRSDVTARSASKQTLNLYMGNGTGGFAGVVPGDIPTWYPSFSGFDLIETAGDLTGDGHPDYLARKQSTGALYVYPTDGAQSTDPSDRIKLGTGWNAMSAIVSGHDYNGDGRIDIIAAEKSTGKLWLYPGKGGASFGTRVLIGTGWNGMSLITAVGDLDHDGVADVIAKRNSDNCLYFYAGKGTGGLKNGVKIGCGWDVMNTIAAVGDFNGDGHVDWVARLKSNGNLYLYAGNGKGSYSSSKVIGTGWGGMNLIV